MNLAGEDGTALTILGGVLRAMRGGGLPAEQLAAFCEEATAGHCEALLTTVKRRVDVE